MEAAAPPDHDPADRELKPILHEEIGRLPSKIREAIVLCYFQGLTVEGAAKRLGCPVGTLKSRLGKGREQLRGRLTRRGVTASLLLLLMVWLTDEASASAEVPESLVDSTLKAGSGRAEVVGVSRRVASMVLQEESRNRWPRAAASWTLLVVLLLVFGGSRMALGRKAEAGPAEPVAVPGVVPALNFLFSTPSDPALMRGDHCRAR